MNQAVSDFTTEVNELVDDFCDIDTRNKESKIYGVTNFNERRLLHMIKYIKDRGVTVPASRYERLANVTDAFLDHVANNNGEYYVDIYHTLFAPQRLKLVVPPEKLRECASYMREFKN